VKGANNAAIKKALITSIVSVDDTIAGIIFPTNVNIIAQYIIILKK